MNRTAFRRLAATAAVALALCASSALALPSLGAARPAVRLVDGWERTLDLSSLGTKPVLVVYEDKDSSAQNQPFKDELSRLAKGDRYKSSIALVAIADVGGYDYWPVRGFVKDAIREQSRKFGTVIFCDWDGTARTALGVKRGVSTVLLYGRDGKVLFANEGVMSPARRKEVIDLLRRQVDG